MLRPRFVVPLMAGAAALGLLAACGSKEPAALVRTGNAVTTTAPEDPYGSSDPTPTSPSTTAASNGTSGRSATTLNPNRSSPTVGRVTTVPPTGTPPPPGSGSAARVQVTPGAVDLRPRPFESAAPSGDRQLVVRYWSGVAPCDVLGRVDVVEGSDRVVITLFSGSDPRAGDRACIELAVYNEVVVDLQSPLAGRRIIDGAA